MLMAYRLIKSIFNFRNVDKISCSIFTLTSHLFHLVKMEFLFCDGIFTSLTLTLCQRLLISLCCQSCNSVQFVLIKAQKKNKCESIISIAYRDLHLYRNYFHIDLTRVQFRMDTPNPCHAMARCPQFPVASPTPN